MKRTIPLFLILALACGGCSTFSKSSRQQRAYEKYVRRSSVARGKQHRMFRNSMPHLPPAQPVSEPVESTSTGPESVSGSEG